MLAKSEIARIKRSIRGADARLPRIFDALGDPGRFSIFEILVQRQDICVTEIAEILGVSLSAASQQLKILELSGLVKKERTGKMICYRIREDEPVIHSLSKLLSIKEKVDKSR